MSDWIKYRLKMLLKEKLKEEKYQKLIKVE
jgi:hypothetical protein